MLFIVLKESRWMAYLSVHLSDQNVGRDHDYIETECDEDFNNTTATA